MTRLFKTEAKIAADAPATSRTRLPAAGKYLLGEIGIPTLLCAAVLVWFLIAALWPNLLAGGNPLSVHPEVAFQAPSGSHWFGTDESGRDIYTRIVHGAGQSLTIGILATLIGMVCAAVLALLAGLLGGVVDTIVGRGIEVMFAFPVLVLALFFVAIVGPGIGAAIVAVGLSTAPGYARILRAEVRSVAASQYITMARIQGLSGRVVLWRHILPNVLWPMLALTTLGLGQAIVWASALSYLGVGATPPAAEWGAMLSAGRTYMQLAWWMTVFPGLAIVVSAGAATVLGRRMQQVVRTK